MDNLIQTNAIYQRSIGQASQKTSSPACSVKTESSCQASTSQEMRTGEMEVLCAYVSILMVIALLAGW